MILVIDTNVWVSGLQFAGQRGTPTLALEKAMTEDAIATCDEMNAEIFRVLTEKFAWEPRRVAEALAVVMALMVHLKIRGTSGSAAIPKTTCSWNVRPWPRRH